MCVHQIQLDEVLSAIELVPNNQLLPSRPSCALGLTSRMKVKFTELRRTPLPAASSTAGASPAAISCSKAVPQAAVASEHSVNGVTAPAAVPAALAAYRAFGSP